MRSSNVSFYISGLCFFIFSFFFPSLSYGGQLEKGLSLTIYNSSFALVKDHVSLNLKSGINPISYDSATMLLEPTSVVLQPIYGSEGDGYRDEEADYNPMVTIAEQSYRNDVLSPSYLLSLFEGKTIDFLVPSQANPGDSMVVKGKVVRSGYQPVGGVSEAIIEVEGKLRFGVPGVALFPSLGEGPLLKPRLEWKLHSTAPFEGAAMLTYITGGLNWSASYNLVLPERGDLANLVGWVNIDNASGRSFEGVKIQLMAGDVSRVHRGNNRARDLYAAAPMSAGALSEAGVVTQKAFDEFHLYTLPGPVTLRDRESKQVEFLSAQNLKVSTIYRYAGSELYNGGGFYEDPNVTLNSAENVSVVRKIVNSESNYLGKPLPAGTLRFYRKDGQDIQFIGEDSIKHTAKNETVEVVTGKAFDVLVKRVRTSFNVEPAGYLAQRKMTESFEFTIKNRKGEDVVVNVVEYFRGPNWEIKGQSHTHRKTSAAEVQWDVPVGKDSEEKLTYVVEYSF